MKPRNLSSQEELEKSLIDLDKFIQIIPSVAMLKYQSKNHPDYQDRLISKVLDDPILTNKFLTDIFNLKSLAKAFPAWTVFQSKTVEEAIDKINKHREIKTVRQVGRLFGEAHRGGSGVPRDVYIEIAKITPNSNILSEDAAKSEARKSFDKPKKKTP